MVYQEWITNIVVGNTTLTVDYLDGQQRVYSDPNDIKEIWRLTADQQMRITNGEDLIEGQYKCTTTSTDPTV
jgi:hypothetical protein